MQTRIERSFVTQKNIIDWNSIDNYSIIIGLCYLLVMELVHSGYMKKNNGIK